MNYRMVKRLAPVVGICILVLAACSPFMPPRIPLSPAAPAEQLSDAEQIAGEIMAYLMEVVLAGPARLTTARPGLPVGAIFRWISTWCPGACSARCPSGRS